MTLTIGYKLSSEEHDATALIRNAGAAEDAGFTLAAISDHFHPWIDRQGQSPFVWAVLGGIATATEQLEVGTLVTCPTVRIHPAIVAQASATVASMMPGRTFLGVGTGERLNEHVLGDRWPEPSVRRSMLEEAVEVIRALWTGDEVSHHGRHYRVEDARLYTVPEALPPIYVAAGGEAAAGLAGRIGDGLVATAPDAEVVAAFRSARGGDGPALAELTVCYAETEAEGLERLVEIWPMPGIPGELSAELPSPRHFEQAAGLVRPEDLKDLVPVGPDPEPYLRAIDRYREAGFDTIVLHQAGPDQEPFLTFAADELIPAIGR
jgi:coenzyme F420-dependent glucose-6-phosphate dehydrogenase